MTSLEVYAALLATEGLLVNIQPDSSLVFKYEGDRYVLQTYLDDPQYVGISATYPLPTGVRRSKALTAANDVTRGTKVGKVNLLPDRGVRIAAELFVNDPKQIDTVLPRLIRLLQISASRFFRSLNKPVPVST